jgi:hypothetical protein
VKPGSDGVIRQEWIVDDHPIPHAPTTPTRAAATVVTPAPIDRAPPVASVAGRVGEWNDRLQAIVDDEIEGGGEELSAVELIAEAVGSLQNAVDRALAVLERQTGETAGEAASEIAALRLKVAELEEARRADEDRHRREVARLAKRMETIGAEVDEVHDALRLEAAEAAEARSITRLRTSSWMRRHNATVGLKLAQRELANGSRQ